KRGRPASHEMSNYSLELLGSHLPTHLERSNHEHRQSPTATERSVRLYPTRQNHRGDERVLRHGRRDAGKRSSADEGTRRQHRTGKTVHEWREGTESVHRYRVRGRRQRDLL